MEQLQLAITFKQLEAWEKAAMKTKLFFIILFVSLTQPWNVYADSVTYPPSYNNIAAGNPANASDVTDAFTAVKSAVDANDVLINNNSSAISTNTSSIADHETRISNLESPVITSYDYRDYRAAPTITTKTFQWVRSTPIPCDREVHQITRTVIDPDTTDILNRTERTDGAATTCMVRENTYTQTADAVFRNVRYDYDPADGTTLLETYTFSTPIKIRTSSMHIGEPIVSTTAVQSTINSHLIEINTLLGIEAVTVPAGTFTNCIKMHKRRNTVIPGHDTTMIDWHCAGIGRVKRIQVFTSGVGGQLVSQSFELLSTN
jgi:hypothetical protein